MYIFLKNKGKTLCDVGIYGEEYSDGTWTADIKSVILIKNYSQFLMDNTDQQMQIAEDFDAIQNFRQQYWEGNGLFPYAKRYDIDEEYKQFCNDKNEITAIIRKKMQDVAKKYNLEYSED